MVIRLTQALLKRYYTDADGSEKYWLTPQLRKIAEEYVKKYVVLKDRNIDLCVSGINHGYNLGVDVYYSGTVAAAREGALRGIPAIAFSSGPKGSFEAGAEVARGMVQRFLVASRPEGRPVLLNVNFPGNRSEYLGIKTTRIGRRTYDEAIVLRHDPRGNEYFWVGGPNAYHEREDGTDTTAVDDGYVSITPLLLEPTSTEHQHIAAFVAGESA